MTKWDDLWEKPEPPPRPATPPSRAPGAGTTPYGAAALAGEAKAIATAPEGTRNDALNLGAFAIGKLVGGGEIDHGDACAALAAAADTSGLGSREIAATLRSGITGGMEHPRSAPPSFLDAARAARALHLEPGVITPVDGLPDRGGPDDHETATTEEPETARPSWAPEDLTGVLDGSSEPLEPTLLPRTDGHCLLYPGRVHSVHGESESGKSLLLQAEAARLLMQGERVVIIDYESTAATVVGRLLQMGVPPDMIREGLAYVRPERSPLDPAEVDSWHDLLDQPAALVVLDGVTEALSTMGRSTNDNDEVTDWVRRVPRQLAQRTGAAVVLVDHVTKSTEGRGRFAIGAQAKLAALDGASYSLEVVEPLGRGMRGTLRLWIGKDREGAVRPHCGRFKPGDRTQLAATIFVDSTAGPITMEVQAPEEIHGDDRKPFRPTYLMEQISRALEGSPTPLTSNALVKGSDYVAGNGQAKRTALDLLVAEGYAVRALGARGAALHTTARPYREAEDAGPSQRLSGAVDRLGLGPPLVRGTQDPVRTATPPGLRTQSDPVGPSGPSGPSGPGGPSGAGGAGGSPAEAVAESSCCTLCGQTLLLVRPGRDVCGKCNPAPLRSAS